MKLRLIVVALVLMGVFYISYLLMMHYPHKAIEHRNRDPELNNDDDYHHESSAIKQRTVSRTSKYGKSLSRNNAPSRNGAQNGFAARVEAENKNIEDEYYGAEEIAEEETAKHVHNGYKKVKVNNHDLPADDSHGVREDNDANADDNIPPFHDDDDADADDKVGGAADHANLYQGDKEVNEVEAANNAPQHHDIKGENRPDEGDVGEEGANDYVSLDDLKEYKTKEEISESVGLDRRRSSKILPRTKLKRPTIGKPVEPVDDMAEIEVEQPNFDPNQLRKKNSDLVVPRSHLRSHNIAPIPRVPGNTLIESSDKIQRSNLSDASMKKTRADTLDDSDFGMLVQQSQDRLEPEAYYLIHSGRASKVNRRLLVNPLPDYIPADHYILKSNR